MAKERALFKFCYDDLFEEIWRELQEGELVIFVVEIKTTKEVCAFCQLDKSKDNIPEFGLDVIDNYMGLGYGKRAAKLVLEFASKWKEVDYFVWKTDIDNIKS